MTRWGAYITAGTLAAVVVTVFAALRDYGPDSALRRFHQAATGGDDGALQRVSKQRLDEDAMRYLRERLRRLDQAGARIAMGVVHAETRIDTIDGQIVKVPSVVTEVRYYVPGRVESIYWVIDHEPSGWLVNAYETAMFPAKRLGVGRTG